ncbi:MAG TPA: hypothetical protein VJA40_02815 [archaeon]|nr:hypothetical protein [archaeon]
MKGITLFAVLAAVFIALNVGIISIFTPLANAKWFDDGLDIVSGLVLLYFGVLTWNEFKAGGDNGFKLFAAGAFLLSFQKAFEVLLQEWQESINYNYPALNGFDSGDLIWGLATLFTFLGVYLLSKGLKELTG